MISIVFTGQRFALREGGRTVGAGVVSKVISWALNQLWSDRVFCELICKIHVVRWSKLTLLSINAQAWPSKHAVEFFLPSTHCRESVGITII